MTRRRRTVHGLPKDVDLSFFEGKRLIQVCIGEYQVIFHFDDDVSLAVEVSIRHSSQDSEYVFRDFKRDRAELPRLLSEVVTAVSTGAKSTLTLTFSNGDSIEVADENEHYESYQITHKGTTVAV